MASRGSAGLLLCASLLLATPVVAATPADRAACAASADKSELGATACSRIIDDAGEPVAERIKAFKNRGRGAFNKKDYDRAIADYGEAIKLSPNDAWALAHRCEAYESKEDHAAAIADCSEAIRIDPKYGWAHNNRGVACYGLHDYDAALADHSEAIRLDSGGYLGLCAPRHGVDGKRRIRPGHRRSHRGGHDRSEIRLWFRPKGPGVFRKRLITKKGGWELAIADYSEAIRLDPNLLWCTVRAALPTATTASTTSR